MAHNVAKLRRHFVPLAEVPPKPPQAIIPGLIVPGFNLIAADPKSYKTTMLLHIIAAVVELKSVGDVKMGRVPAKRGSAFLIPAEQSRFRLRHKYESEVVKHRLPDPSTTGKTNFDIIIAREPHYWQLDDEEIRNELIEFIEEWEPTILGIDPYYYFHSIEEKSGELAKPLLPLRAAVLRYGGALVVAHHTSKADMRGTDSRRNFSRVRGHSALWAAADAGILMTRLPNGAVTIACEFKDHPGTVWTWRPMALPPQPKRLHA